MGESLIQPCRVVDEGPLGCKYLLSGKKYLILEKLTVPDE